MLKKQIDAKGRRLLLVGGSSNFSPFVENTHNRFPSTLLSFPIFRFSVCKSAVNILYMQVSTVNKLHMHMICTLINFFLFSTRVSVQVSYILNITHLMYTYIVQCFHSLYSTSLGFHSISIYYRLHAGLNL